MGISPKQKQKLKTTFGPFFKNFFFFAKHIHVENGFDIMLKFNETNSISKDALRDEDCP